MKAGPFNTLARILHERNEVQVQTVIFVIHDFQV